MSFIYRWYPYLFAKPFFAKLNKVLYQLSLRGLGVLNFESKYLSGEKQWVKSYLEGKDSPTVLDVGANIGNYSIDVFECNPNARVYAFEPHPLTYARLLDNMKGYSNCIFKSFNLGVGQENGELELFDYVDKSGSEHASLYKEVISDLHKGEVVSCKVKIISLEEFFINESINRVDLLKIDTEGNEFKVLLGLGRLIKEKKISAIHIEFNEMNIISGVTFKNFWDLLSDYNFYRLLPGGKLLPVNTYSPISCELYGFQNIVAILKGN